MLKLIHSLLKLAHLLSNMEAHRAEAAQRRYKRRMHERYVLCRVEADRLSKQAEQERTASYEAQTASILGDNNLNERERKARSLAIKLKH